MLGGGINSLIPNKGNSGGETPVELPVEQSVRPTPVQDYVPAKPTPVPTPPTPAPEVEAPTPEPTPVIPEPAPVVPAPALPTPDPIPEPIPPMPAPEHIPVPTQVPAPQIPVTPVAETPAIDINPSYQVNLASSNNLPKEETPEPKKEKPAISKNFSKDEPTDHIFQIEVEKIKANPYQPRRHFDDEALSDLANSIAEYGIIQPLVVSKNVIETENGTNVEYELIAGERRLRAAKRAGLERVPVIIKKAPAKKEKLELAIIENIQREDLNPIESARSFAQLQDDYGMTQREIASRMGKSREVIANTMRLLSLPTYIQESIEQGKISESQGRLLLGVDDISSQQNLFEDLLKNGLTVRELRNKISNNSARSNAIKRFENSDPELRALAEKLSDILGTKVKIDKNGETGKITISFQSADDLKGIIDRVVPENEL